MSDRPASRSLVTSATLAAALLAAGAAPRATRAQPAAAPTGAAALFAKYDITEDGWLSGTELRQCGCARYDANGDGEVTRAEFIAGRARDVVTKDGPRRAAPATPAAAPPAAAAARGAGPALGVYACSATSMRGTFMAYPDAEIAAGGRYVSDGKEGRFAYDAATRQITWTSGVNAHDGWTGEYFPPGVDGMDVPTFVVRSPRGVPINCKHK